MPVNTPGTTDSSQAGTSEALLPCETTVPECYQIRLIDDKLPQVVRAGFVVVKPADKLLLMNIYYSREGTERISLNLTGHRKNTPFSGSNVSIYMFRMQNGAEAFQKMLEWWARDKRKNKLRFADGTMFDSSILALKKTPTGWDHEAYAHSKSSIVHIYQSPQLGVIFRYRSDKDTVLTDPLLQKVNKSLSIDPEAWVFEPPVCVPRRKSPSGTDRPLKKNESSEITEAISRAAQFLKIDLATTSMESVQNSIYAAINEQTQSRISRAKAVDCAIDFGCLWGHSLCESLGWEWCYVKTRGNGARYAVASPDRRFFVAPMVFIQTQLRKRGATTSNTSLLLYNMICHGNMPVVSERAYHELA